MNSGLIRRPTISHAIRTQTMDTTRTVQSVDCEFAGATNSSAAASFSVALADGVFSIATVIKPPSAMMYGSMTRSRDVYPGRSDRPVARQVQVAAVRTAPL